MIILIKMEVSRMSMGIIKKIDKQYNQYLEDDCLDIVQIKNICNLYKTKSISPESVSIGDINLSSPEFKKTKLGKQNDILKTPEFQKKYAFFIRIIYACLKINVDIFDVTNEIITLKNNYQLTKALESRKKKLIEEHIVVLKNQYRCAIHEMDLTYEKYVHDYLAKIKILDKIFKSINKLISSNIIGKTDSLFSLVLPYFYTYTEYIEEYN